MIPIILGMETQGVNVTPLWWALAIGVGMGGNGTHLGSTAKGDRRHKLPDHAGTLVPQGHAGHDNHTDRVVDHLLHVLRFLRRAAFRVPAIGAKLRSKRPGFSRPFCSGSQSVLRTASPISARTYVIKASYQQNPIKSVAYIPYFRQYPVS
jgi:hypothetical protein